ncbi:MAG: hypothetical protein Q8N36_02740, partial [bacterium]|nr:hypothetical protein [bacterium]
MLSNYIFITVLILFWVAAFVLPKRHLLPKGINKLKAFHSNFAWWLLSMSYFLLGFLLPGFLVPPALDFILKYTLALPCYFGVMLENY